MDERGISESDLRAWLETRFPEAGRSGDRLADADRRWRRRRLLILLLPLTLVVALAGGVVAGAVLGRRSSDPPPSPRPDSPAETHPGLLVLVVVLWAVAIALQVYGLWRLQRANRELARAPQARVLRAVGARQRRELMDEVRGRRPAVPGDEPVLDHLARTMLAGVWQAVALAGLVLLLVANQFVATGAAPLVRLSLLPAALVVVGAVLFLRDRRRALAYLRRREQDQPGVPFAP